MKLHAILICLGLFLLNACDDVASNRSTPPPARGRESQDSEQLPLSLPSGIIRNRGSRPLTYNSEISRAGRPSTEYRSVPDMEYDDEGLNGRSVETRSYLGRPKEECGLIPKQTLKARINHCKKLNGKTATWNGIKHASSTEGNWELVALKVHSSSTQEIWLDHKTGMLWSDIIKATNWCEASGNEQNLTDVIKINCMDLMKNSSCFGVLHLGISEINWRLPTRNDYLQADLDGLRFVLKKGDGNGFWTATMNSASLQRDQAWTYNSDRSGLLEVDSLTSHHQVRCVGVSTL